MRTEFFADIESRRDLRMPSLREILQRMRCAGCGHFVGHVWPVPFLRLCRDCVREVAA